MSGQYDFTIDRNSTVTRTVVWKDVNGTPVPLAGYSAVLQIRQAPSATSVVLELSTVNGKLAINGAAGSVTLTISPTDTLLLTARRYFYDLRLVSGTGLATRLLQGVIIVSPEVTR
jgi:hypothetical protein